MPGLVRHRISTEQKTSIYARTGRSAYTARKWKSASVSRVNADVTANIRGTDSVQTLAQHNTSTPYLTYTNFLDVEDTVQSHADHSFIHTQL